MIKASAGGGGKGMRIAWNNKEAKEGFTLSQQEAASSFGDDRILVEKFVDKPRHIEIQILGDKHGNAIYLNERECSIQRRNQKVIEEAPSVFLDPETRKAMGEQAVALSKNIGYSSAGTVEFLVDSKKNFYFLEMNTRLQVEHPITECITGVDIVHQMIRSAKGYPLRLKQSDIPIRGWAIESRVYAEDPFKNFGLPSIGRLTQYQEPLHIDNVRCDSGVEEGSDISIYYDAMICKLVCWGDTREEAIKTSIKALDSYVIRGVTHNIPLLRDILAEEKFNLGELTTDYLPSTYPDGFKGKQLSQEEKFELASVIGCLHAKDLLRNRQLIGTLRQKSRDRSPIRWDVMATIMGEQEPITIIKEGEHFRTECYGRQGTVKSTFDLAAPLLPTNVNGNEEVMQLIEIGIVGDIKIRYKGTAFHTKVMSKEAQYLTKLMPKKVAPDKTMQIVAPMPGLVKSVSCAVGDEVAEGQQLCIIEAMKMQNSLAAAHSGKVKIVNIKVGQTVEEDELLVELE
uniref:Propionyl-CoA carboxylase alpha chain, mitochondrial n=1 Tax=Hirondellea gigas TaxID=1518452 RepID=A0A6A7FM23_9CRUS